MLFVITSAYALLVFGGKANDKLYALGKYIKWEIRAQIYDGPDKHSETPAEHFVAEILGVTSDGHVVFTRGSENGTVQVEAELADLNILDLEGTTKIINRYKGKRVFVDYYQYEENGVIHDCVVIWDEFEAPINVEVVERHFAEPIEKPPTNVVNMLMASYFWKVFKEGK